MRIPPPSSGIVKVVPSVRSAVNAGVTVRPGYPGVSAAATRDVAKIRKPPGRYNRILNTVVSGTN